MGSALQSTGMPHVEGAEIEISAAAIAVRDVMAGKNVRGEILVRGTSGHPQLFLIRDGHRDYVGSLDWCERNEYSAEDVMLVEDVVIMQVPQGRILT